MTTKFLLYALTFLLLGSCSLWSSVPQKVLDGQRGIYQGIIVLEENGNAILDAYEQDNKAAITYHVNFIYQQKIESIASNLSLSNEDKRTKLVEAEFAKDSEIREAFTKIELRRQEMGVKIAKNALASKRLVEAVYSYLSSTPITIDNVDFWIEKIVEVSYGRN